MSLRDDIARILEGDVMDDVETLAKYSRDTSIFERKPSLVVFPKNTNDVVEIVKYVAAARERGEHISIAARAAGTDMSGGPLTDSIVLVFTKYMNHMFGVEGDEANAESGVYYRDFEKETLAKTGKLLPPYPASRELAALGGLIANNAGGELTLRFGKMDRYVRELDVVLSDGSRATLRPMSMHELAGKETQQDLEGKIYREIHSLIEKNADEIALAQPSVSKNSSGYPLWSVWDKKRDIFDITKLVTGSQGTLALITSAKLGLEKQESHRGMLVVFLSDISVLPEIVRRVRTFEPESFESYDDNTFKLATRYEWDFIRKMGFLDSIRLGLAFLPEIWMAVTGGVPKLVLLAEFAEKSNVEAREKAEQAQLALQDIPVKTRLAYGMMEEKYWKIRRESFALLGKHIDGIIRTPYLYLMFSPKMLELFADVKKIFDPLNILNPGKKTGGTVEDINRSMIAISRPPSAQKA